MMELFFLINSSGIAQLGVLVFFVWISASVYYSVEYWRFVKEGQWTKRQFFQYRLKEMGKSFFAAAIVLLALVAIGEILKFFPRN
jgi:hypothetical protein